ncbi:unnamed protein product [Caenorhabditis sp. 36 PRJEB53466]|nr:unnamed protein product [Caenorhabditis sp. 36 PRJEB53466]
MCSSSSSTSLFLLLTLINKVSGSGYLELTLRSPWKQEVAVSVYQASSAFGSIKSALLRPNEASSLKFPVNYNQTAKIVITVGGSPNYGLQSTRLDALLTPIRGVLTPEKVPAPFDGFKIGFECDTNYYGEHCYQFCNNEVALKYGKRCNSAGFTSCPHGFMGQSCIEMIRHQDCPCQNNGQCATSFLSESQEVPLCECSEGFYGPVCQSPRDVRNVTFTTNYTPEFRFVPQIIEKYYNGMKMENRLISVKKRVNIAMERRSV